MAKAPPAFLAKAMPKGKTAAPAAKKGVKAPAKKAAPFKKK
jgi:hypothetical protein